MRRLWGVAAGVFGSAILTLLVFASEQFLLPLWNTNQVAVIIVVIGVFIIGTCVGWILRGQLDPKITKHVQRAEQAKLFKLDQVREFKHLDPGIKAVLSALYDLKAMDFYGDESRLLTDTHSFIEYETILGEEESPHIPGRRYSLSINGRAFLKKHPELLVDYKVLLDELGIE